MDKESYKELQRGLLTLTSPFEEVLDFKVSQNLSLEDKQEQAEWEEDLLSIEEIKQKAMWKLDCTLEGQKLSKFVFEFNPLPTMDKLEKRIVGLDDLSSSELAKKLATKKYP